MSSLNMYQPIAYIKQSNCVTQMWLAMLFIDISSSVLMKRIKLVNKL